MGAQQSVQQASLPPCKGGQEAMSGSTCPVPEVARRQPVYNVYSQRIDAEMPQHGSTSGSAAVDTIDSRNNMPLAPNQQPAPGQRQVLSTDRVVSNIPKGGTDATWVYPSPQMFYNALKRKGKDDGLQEDGTSQLPQLMNNVVSTHNMMNEMTWDRVKAWEKLHPESREDAQLNRFVGRPHDRSPLACLRTLLGYSAPFDRHDWFVLRDGREVRYVVDFYFDEARAGLPEAFEIVERPALDSFESALDRVKMAIYVQCAKLGVPCPVTGDRGKVVQHVSHP